MRLPRIVALDGRIGGTLDNGAVARMFGTAGPRGFAFCGNRPSRCNGLLMNGAVLSSRKCNVFIGFGLSSGIVVGVNSKIDIHCCDTKSRVPTGCRLLLAFGSSSFLIFAITVCNFVGICPSDCVSGGCCGLDQRDVSPLDSGCARTRFRGLITRTGGALSTGTLLTAGRHVPNMNGNMARSVLFGTQVGPGRGILFLSSGRGRILFGTLGRALISVAFRNKHSARASLCNGTKNCGAVLSTGA